MKSKFKRKISGLIGIILAMQGLVMPVSADEGDIQTVFDLTGMYTTGYIYNDNLNYTGGNAGYAGAWYYSDFISDKYVEWKTPWIDGMTDNILIANGVEFELRVISGNNGNCVMRNRSDNEVYTNLDVEDGAYTEIDFLVNSDRASSSTDKKYIGVKLNYTDGTSEISECYINYFANQPDETEMLKRGVRSRRCNSGKDTVYGNLSQVIFEVNPEKELESVDIINDRFEWVKGTDGEYVIENGEYKTKMHESANSRGKYKYISQIYAVTLITNEETIKKAQEEKVKKQIKDIENAIDALGGTENLEFSQKADVDKIGEMIDKAVKDGIVVEEKISNYQVYLDAVVRMEELYRERVYKDIENAIDALGTIEELEYSQKKELEEIEKMIEAAEENGYAVNEETVSNLSKFNAALIRMNELYIESVLKVIEDKITALGDINKLTYDDIDKINEINELIEEKEKENIQVNEKTLSNYSVFKEAESIVKSMMPVSKPVDISPLYNVGNIYGPNGGSVTGEAGYAGRIVYGNIKEDFEWKYEWDEDRIDNIVNVNGTNYQLRVVDAAVNSGYCVFRNNNQKDKYTNIDVEDKNYTAVNILANSERATDGRNPKFLGVKLNYTDGSSEVFEKELAYFCNAYGKGADGGLSVVRMSGEADPELKGYIGNFEIKADFSKKLDSIDIINDCFLWSKDGEGNYIYENGQPVLSVGEKSRANAYHGTQIYAVSVIMPKGQYIADLKAELEEKEKALDNRYDLSGGVISDEAAEIFFSMREGFEYIGDEKYESKFSNYSAINSVMPEFVGGSYKERDDLIEATLEFNTKMKNISDYISISQGDAIIDKYVIKEEGNFVKILFNNRFDYDNEIKITISKKAMSELSDVFTLGVTKAYRFLPEKKLVVTNMKITDESGNVIDKVSEFAGTTIKVSAKLTNEAGVKSKYFAIAGLYDENGSLIACKNFVNTLEAGKSANVNTELSTEGKTGLILKIMWLDTAMNMKTVSDTVIK